LIPFRVVASILKLVEKDHNFQADKNVHLFDWSRYVNDLRYTSRTYCYCSCSPAQSQGPSSR
jgi:hypothetical protein